MKLGLPKRARPSKALASPHDGRPALLHGHVLQQGKGRVLFTSDSFIMAVLPVASDTPLGAIQGEALTRLERGAKHDLTARGVRFPLSDGEVTYPSPKSLPPVTTIPAVADSSGIRRVALDVTLLKRLADAIGAQKNQQTGVVLEIPENPEGIIRVTALVTALSDPSETYGLLMPMRLNR